MLFFFSLLSFFFFFQAEDGIRDDLVTGVQTCALPISIPFFATYRPLSTTIRAIVEACLYLVAEGCRWRALPKDFPPWQTVRWWWDRFRREGVWDRATRALTPAARTAAGRGAEPRTGLVDSPSVR